MNNKSSKTVTKQVEEGMRLRHAFVEEAGDKLSAARHMAYLSHLDRGELLAEVERLRPMAESWESYEAAQDRKGSSVETTGCARCKEHEQFRHQHRDCDSLAVALQWIKLSAVSLADAQVIALEALRGPEEPTPKCTCDNYTRLTCDLHGTPDRTRVPPEKASGDYCVCGKSQLARGQRGYYCKGCGKDLHPDNYETYPGEPITGIYEAGVAIVRLGKDDELGPGGD